MQVERGHRASGQRTVGAAGRQVVGRDGVIGRGEVAPDVDAGGLGEVPGGEVRGPDRGDVRPADRPGAVGLDGPVEHVAQGRGHSGDGEDVAHAPSRRRARYAAWSTAGTARGAGRAAGGACRTGAAGGVRTTTTRSTWT